MAKAASSEEETQSAGSLEETAGDRLSSAACHARSVVVVSGVMGDGGCSADGKGQ
jgi:hypothetical protein